jgi:phosphonate metabolism protein PhnN/1,5-bisphosphokinase (PRPP-forming)
MPGAEDHLPLDEAQFTALAEAGGFALHWAANGLRYGIFRGIEAELAAGHVVVANLSRLVLVDAARRYPLRVLDVTAPPAVLAQRIAGRGREDAAATAARLARTVPIPPGLDVEAIVNDGPPEAGIAAMLAALNRAAADARRPGRAPPAPLG